MKIVSYTQTSLRINRRNPNHHLWLNNGTWFLHYATHTGFQKGRVRTSLGTKCLAIARERRDAALAHLRHQACLGLPASLAGFFTERRAA
jgi:hypothetical protein